MADVDYQGVTRRTRETVLRYSQEQWPVCKTANGVEVSYYDNPETPGKVYKSVGLVNASPATVFEYILPGPLRMNWDKQVKSWELMKEVQEGLFILRSLSHGAAMGLIAPREYIDIVGISRNDDDNGLYFSYATGIDYPYPEDPSYTRGMNYPSAMMCFPSHEGHSGTKLVYIFQTDLKGKIPPKLVDATLPSIHVAFFKNLRKAISEKVKEKTGTTSLC